MKMNRIFLPVLGWLLTLNLVGQVPAGYYTGTTGLYGNALKSALHQVIQGHTPVAYTQLFTCFATTDDRPNGSVWDMYSDNPGGTPPYVYYFVPSDQCGNYSQEGDCFNREHSFPKSWFGGDIMPMYSDLFHLYPTDGYVNGQRGNLPYGETSNPDWTSLNGSKRGPSSVPGYTGNVFEPIDEYKGDLARTYFYMAVRYYSEDLSWPGSPMTNGAQPTSWALSMLLQWHQADAVSQKEIDRNNAVYSYQGNRNPFIDTPYFAERIWVTSAGSLSGFQEENRWIVYPQPAREDIFLRASEPLDRDRTIVIRDALGRTAAEHSMKTGTTELRIPRASLPAGMYTLCIDGAKGRFPVYKKVLIISR
jgi:endonuclease I